MGKKNKSKRFVQQGSDAVMRHDEKFPYHLTMAQAEALKQRNDSSLGGF
ncbi:MAG: competence protein [Ectobacillus sp.]